MSLLDTIRSWMGEADLRGYTVGETLLPAVSTARTTPSGYSAAVPAPPQAPAGGDTPGKRGLPGSPVERSTAQALPDLTTIGAAGTPVLSGFITDLQEYNPQMRGRTALAVYEQMRRSDADVAAALAACKLPIRSA